MRLFVQLTIFQLKQRATCSCYDTEASCSSYCHNPKVAPKVNNQVLAATEIERQNEKVAANNN